MKDAARKSYARKGDAVVASNVAAIEEGAQKCVEVAVSASWANAELDACGSDEGLPAVVTNILRPVNAQKGDELPVSAFAGYEDGVIDMGLTAFEKRGIAVTTPMWRADACIQCNRCAFVCPHAAIRPYLVSEEEAAAAPAGFETVALKGGKNLPDGMRFTLQVSHLDWHELRQLRRRVPVRRAFHGTRQAHRREPHAVGIRLGACRQRQRVRPLLGQGLASSNSPSSSSRQHVQDAARRPTQSCSPSCSATACTGQTPRLLAGVGRIPSPASPIPQTSAASVRHGPTAFSRTTPNFR